MEDPLLELQEYDNLVQVLKSGKRPLQVTGTPDSQEVHPMYELGEASVLTWKLVITYDDTRAKEIYDDFRSSASQVWLYLAKGLLFYSAGIHGDLTTRQRIAMLHHLMRDRGGVAVATMDGFVDYLLPLKYLKEQFIMAESGQVVDLDPWKERLVAIDYERAVQVDDIRQFSIRDGIVDTFPLAEEVPVCIKPWDDEVDSIHTFDLGSQHSMEQLESITIYPAAEAVLSGDQLAAGIGRLGKGEKIYEKVLKEQHKLEEAHRVHTIIEELKNGLDERWRIDGLDAYIRHFCPDTVSLLEYFPQGGSVIYLDEPIRLEKKGETVELEFREDMVHRLEKGYLLPGQTGLLYPAAEVLARIRKPFAVMLIGLGQKFPGMKMNQRLSIDAKNVNSYQNSFETLIKDLTRWKREGCRVTLLSSSRIRVSRLASDLREYDLRTYYPGVRETDSRSGGGDNTGSSGSGSPVVVSAATNKVRPGGILATYSSLHRRFEYPFLKSVFITEDDMFGVEKKKKRHKKTNCRSRAIQSLIELSVGDYMVHEEHGLGIYKGIEKVERDKIIKDYIKIERGSGGDLYLPATHPKSIQKYAEAEAKKLKLNKLGGAEQNKTRTRVWGAVREVTKGLVKLYAACQEETGFQYGPDTVWQGEFEGLFPYNEADNRMDVIDAVKEDMESRKIVDRLICDDVGYDKIEVALRAVFKAIQGSKQAVYPVPTTILAQQHYNTFAQRVKDFLVRVDMLSRFCMPVRQKRTLEDLRKGMVDVVTDTYQVLSKDMQFKDLGLLIIDEEQRFGVTHKEKIGHLKENVNVSTLTAAPVPRTLHMSLTGIGDMSVLEEPPVDRMSTQTYAMEYSEEMACEAINRELARDGQVYYVYNRVTSIDEVTGRVQALVSDAVITLAHDQMREYELERITADFINGEIGVLVSATITETGLDIPNTNTIIIHDAGHMRLSQLYQLRDWIGRSNRTSYAFPMYKRDKPLRGEAEKRPQAIQESTELGFGIKIAIRDLGIRGVGDVLGAEQHDHMEAVGYDLYCKMLNQAVLALKGEILGEDSYEITVGCDIDVYIPERYIKNGYQKLDIYKRISAIETGEEYMDMQDGLMGRFGDIPHSVENLLKVAAIRALVYRAYVTEVAINRQEARLTMHQKARPQVGGIPGLVRPYKGDLKLVPGGIPSFRYADRRNRDQDNLEVMGKVEEILKNMCGIRI